MTTNRGRRQGHRTKVVDTEERRLDQTTYSEEARVSTSESGHQRQYGRSQSEVHLYCRTEESHRSHIVDGQPRSRHRSVDALQMKMAELHHYGEPEADAKAQPPFVNEGAGVIKNDTDTRYNVTTKPTEKKEKKKEMLPPFSPEKRKKEELDDLLNNLELISAYEAEDLSDLHKRENISKDVFPLIDETWESIKKRSLSKVCDHLLCKKKLEPPFHQIVAECSKMSKQGMRYHEDKAAKCVVPVGEVIKAGEAFASEERFVHAIIAYHCASNIHMLNENGDVSIRNIQNCVHKVSTIVRSVEKMEQGQKIIMGDVVPLMLDMVENLRTVGGTKKIKVEQEAWCLCRIGLCYSCCGQYERYAQINEEAIHLLCKEFKEEVSSYLVYAHCLDNAGYAYGIIGDYEMAVKKYQAAVKAKECIRWQNEDKKCKAIEVSQSALRRNEVKMRKERGDA